MRFAFTSFSRPHATLEELITLAQELGYDAIEPRAQSQHAHGVELIATADQRRTIRSKLHNTGISICCIGTGCTLGTFNAVKQVDLAKQFLDLAADIGCPCIRVFAGVDATTEPLIDSLRQLAPVGLSRKLCICLETHDSHTAPPLVANVMREVDAPTVGVVWDVMHTQRQGKQSMADAYRILAPWIRHVHVHDGLDTLEKLHMLPIGEGDFDHRAVLRLLKQSNYPGYISGEWIAGCMDESFFVKHLEREIVTLKRLEQEFA